ncbi:MAG TPA: 4-hydroxy-3-methylbut-2-enyl diphosphate reductase [Bacteroidales bacterium]|nr:4-hydroxy-3-methylbut-2-enyl diphosphate reductase [Bacteroidales bacterium]
MKIDIDIHSGFCFGVTNAVKRAEEELARSGSLYCLGKIVHNKEEVERLENLGLITIDRDHFRKLTNTKVLIRAHGEPPETYEIARINNLELIDATCPVVHKLQTRISRSSLKMNSEKGQVIIFGKPGHPEVEGLMGQTNGEALVVKNAHDLDSVSFNKPAILYSQTTKPVKEFEEIKQALQDGYNKAGFNSSDMLEVHNTTCRQVSGREENITRFAANHDLVLFVSYKESSNGQLLFDACKQGNPSAHFISSPVDIKKEWLEDKESAGVCGATSTPLWLMEEVAENIRELALVTGHN